MKVNLLGLQNSAIESINNLQDVLDRQTCINHEFVRVPIDELEKAFNELRNDLVLLAGLIDPETGKSALDNENVKIRELDYYKYE